MYDVIYGSLKFYENNVAMSENNLNDKVEQK